MLNLTVLEQLWELGKNEGGYLTSVISGCDIDSRIDRQTLIDTIWIWCGNMEPIANDIDRFRRLTVNWFERKKYWIKNLLDTLEYDYNPIHNYDRTEVGKRHRAGLDIQDGSSKTKGTASGTNSVSPWDNTSPATYIPCDSNSSTTSGDSTVTNSLDTTADENFDTHISGNIGVTTTQQMIEAQRNVINIDVYELIAKRYVDDNFYMLY